MSNNVEIWQNGYASDERENRIKSLKNGKYTNFRFFPVRKFNFNTMKLKTTAKK